MAETIKEFLVSLGYKVDTQSQARFTDALADASKAAAGVGVALAAAGVAVVKGVEQYAEYGEKLYWISQRANASASGLSNLGFAASQLGSSAGAAYGSVEALGRFLQSSPGAKDWLERWIGPFEKSDEALVKFGRRFKDAPAYLRNQIAETIGLDYGFAQSLYSGEFEKTLEDRAKAAAAIGVDQDEFAKRSKEFEQRWRDFWGSLKLIAENVASDMMPAITRQLDGLNDWIVKNGPAIAKWINGIGDEFEEVERRARPSINGLVLSLGELESALDRQFGDVLPKFSGTLGGDVKNALDTITMLIRALTDAINLDLSAALIKVGTLIRNSFTIEKGGVLDRVLDWLGSLGGQSSYGQSVAPGGVAGGAGAMDVSGGSGGDVPEGDPEAAIAYFMRKGWTREQASGIVANLWEESNLRREIPQTNPKLNDGGKAYGAAQWHADRQADFKRVFGKDIREASFTEQLAFVDWELRNTEASAGKRLGASRSARMSGDIVSRYYERPADREGEAAERAALAAKYFAMGGGSDAGSMMASASGGPVINQTLNITVTGGGDPTAISTAIGQEVGRQNATLVRELGGAVR